MTTVFFLFFVFCFTKNDRTCTTKERFCWEVVKAR